jgi:transcriptional regulator with XRE-family HTH domain
MNSFDGQRLMSAHHTKQLVAFRRNHQLTQEGLAEILGVTAATISRWETKAQSPGPQHIALLEKLFGVQAINSLEEWRFRVNRSAGYEVLFDELGVVLAVSKPVITLSGMKHNDAIGLRAFQLLPGTAGTEAEAEYSRHNYFSHRSKMFTGQMRLVQFKAELRTSGFAYRIAGEYWPVAMSEGVTCILFTFLPIGPILDQDWHGAFRMLAYRAWPVVDSLFTTSSMKQY